MNALLDQILVGALIAGAVGYLALRFFGKRKSGKSCGDCCSGGGSSRKMPE
jgi:hypothetical protein